MTFREYPSSTYGDLTTATVPPPTRPSEPDWVEPCRYAPDTGAHDFTSAAEVSLLYCRNCGAYRL